MKKNLFKFISLLTAIVVLLSLTSCKNSVDESESTTGESTSYYTYPVDGIKIQSVFGYTGLFTEDGSDIKRSNTLCVKLYNSTDKTLQYMLLNAVASDGTAVSFKATTLPPHQSMRVLEQSGKTYADGMTLSSFSSDEYLFFEEEPDAMTEEFSFSATDGVLTVQNISDGDAVGDITIYYKTVDEDGLMGGITYRAVISDGIKSGKMKQCSAKHFSKDTSRVMFVTITESESQT